jgi:hypothetical protein
MVKKALITVPLYVSGIRHVVFMPEAAGCACRGAPGLLGGLLDRTAAAGAVGKKKSRKNLYNY